jgi:hypothetical protein
LARKRLTLPSLRKLKFRRLAVVLAGLMLLTYSGMGLWQRHSKTNNPKPVPSSSQVITTSTNDPDETPVSLQETYNVPADQPRSISLPTIGANGFVQKVSVDQHNAIAVPNNVNFVGWFTGGAKPGGPGLSIIDGHVQGRYKPGIFKNLSSLKSGDTFQVEYGDRTKRHFKVVRITSYSVADAGREMFKQDSDIESQLNLITCGGRFDSKAQQYEQRVLVVSKKLD